MKTLKEKMMRKRGQTEVIVTVLLVLIALAAVAAIAYFIVKNVRQGATGADLNAQCVQLIDFEITKVNLESETSTKTNITIKRGTSAGADIRLANGTGQFKVYVGGANSTLTTAPNLAAGEEKVFVANIKAVSGDNIEASPVLEQNNYVCNIKVQKTYTA